MLQQQQKRKADSSRARVQLSPNKLGSPFTPYPSLGFKSGDLLLSSLLSLLPAAKKDFLPIIFNFDSRRQRNHLQIGL